MRKVTNNYQTYIAKTNVSETDLPIVINAILQYVAIKNKVQNLKKTKIYLKMSSKVKTLRK